MVKNLSIFLVFAMVLALILKGKDSLGLSSDSDKTYNVLLTAVGTFVLDRLM